jgi:hypothetical protein
MLNLGNLLQTIPSKNYRNLFDLACLLDENGDAILQEDGSSCIVMENASGAISAPDIEGIPVILGVPTEGQTLQATSATIIGNPTPTISWQWETSADGSTGWASISGAASSAYIIQSSDAGNYLRVVQTATNTEGTDTETSAVTSQVQAANDADYQDLLNAATLAGYNLPSSSQRVHQNTLVEELKTAGVWSKLEGLWVYSNDASSTDFAMYNWIDEEATKAQVVNTLSHAGDGFTGTGAGYIETNHVAGSGGLFSNVDASWGVFSNTEFNTTTANQYAISSDSANQRVRYINEGQNGNKFLSSDALVAAPSSTVGLMGMQKSGSGLVRGLQADGSRTTIESGLADANLSVNTVKNLYYNGTSYNGNVGLCWVGSKLTASEWSAFVTAVDNYMTNKDS